MSVAGGEGLDTGDGCGGGSGGGHDCGDLRSGREKSDRFGGKHEGGNRG